MLLIILPLMIKTLHSWNYNKFYLMFENRIVNFFFFQNNFNLSQIARASIKTIHNHITITHTHTFTSCALFVEGSLFSSQKRFVWSIIRMNSDWSTRPSPLMSASSIISSSSFCVNFIPASSQAIFKLSNDIEPDLSVREREREHQ